MLSSLCVSQLREEGTSRAGERGGMQRAAGACSFSLGRVPAQRFPEPSSDQTYEWEGTSPPPASQKQSFCSAFFLEASLEREAMAVNSLRVPTVHC